VQRVFLPPVQDDSKLPPSSLLRIPLRRRAVFSSLQSITEATDSPCRTIFASFFPSLSVSAPPCEQFPCLNRQPAKNRSPGVCKNNLADDCMEFIRRDIKGLISGI
jgi:hypothetical protein